MLLNRGGLDCHETNQFQFWHEKLSISTKPLYSKNRIVASLQLKNERGERLTSHRSDHVTGVWGDVCAT